jgi:hypothetical protein
MEFLKEIFTEKNKWHPGCSHIGSNNYSYGQIGRTGPKGPDSPQEKDYIMPEAGTPANTKIGPAIRFDFHTSMENINKIKALILNDPEVSISTHDIYTTITNPNYDAEKKVYDSEMEKYEIFSRAFQSLIDKCKSKGVNALDYLYRDEYHYEKDDIDGYTKFNHSAKPQIRIVDPNNAAVGIMMHSGTKMYQYLLKEGILEKTYPEWYRKGEY